MAFGVIYQFDVKEGREEDFIAGWRSLTSLTRKHEGSFGSRLHHYKDLTYIAYALWPDREAWEKSGEKMVEEAKQARHLMRDACHKVETLFDLNLLEDLLEGVPENLR